MQSWNLNEVDAQPGSPRVLGSAAEGRAIVLDIAGGERLGEHQVHERGWLVVVSGNLEISEPDGDRASGGAGLLVEFDPNERREITATEDSRLLLLLSPWPGEGHPSSRS